MAVACWLCVCVRACLTACVRACARECMCCPTSSLWYCTSILTEELAGMTQRVRSSSGRAGITGASTASFLPVGQGSMTSQPQPQQQHDDHMLL